MNQQQLDYKQIISIQAKEIFLRNTNQFAQYIVQKYVLDCDFQNVYEIPAIYDRLIEIFKFLNSKELLMEIEMQCSLVLFRLIYSKISLTREQYEYRQKKVILLANWIAKSNLRPDIYDITGITSKSLDFLQMVKLAKQCHTLSVAATFFKYLCSQCLTRNQIITPSYGFFIQVIEEMCNSFECKHYWLCPECRNFAKKMYDQGKDWDTYISYTVIDEIQATYYPTRKFGQGTEHIIEFVQKDSIAISQLLTDEISIATLSSCQKDKIPRKFILSFAFANEKLIQYADRLQICQRSSVNRQFWPQYVDKAKESVAFMLEMAGLKQTDEKYNPLFTKYTKKIVQQLISNTLLLPLALDIQQQLLDKFQFELWVPQQLKQIVCDKLIYSISLMASEQIVNHVVGQAKQLFDISQANVTSKKNQQMQLQPTKNSDDDESDDDAISTQNEERSNIIGDINDEDIKQQMQLLDEIFAEQKPDIRNNQIQWEDMLLHSNFAVFPYAQVHGHYVQVSANYNMWNQAQSLVVDQVSEIMQIKKDNNLPETAPYSRVCQNIISTTVQDKQLIDKIALSNYISNFLCLQHSMTHYVNFSSKLNYDSNLGIISRVLKSMLSSINFIAQQTQNSQFVSLLNIQACHPICIQLHSLRYTFSSMMKQSSGQTIKFMNSLLDYLFASIIPPSYQPTELQIENIQYSVTSQQKNKTTLYNLDYKYGKLFDITNFITEQYSSFQQQILNYFKPDSSIVQVLKDRQFIPAALCTPSSCQECFSLYLSIPFAVYEIVHQILDENYGKPEQLDNKLQQYLKSLISFAIQIELLNLSKPGNHDIFELVYYCIINIIQRKLLSPTNVDQIIKTAFNSTTAIFYQVSQQIGVPSISIQNKCVKTLSAICQAIIYCSFGYESIQLKHCRQLYPIDDFSSSISLIEEIIVASMETTAIIARSNQIETGQNESIFKSSDDLPPCFNQLILLRQNIGRQCQVNDFVLNSFQSGFNVSLSNALISSTFQLELDQINTKCDNYLRDLDNNQEIYNNYITEQLLQFQEQLAISQQYYSCYQCFCQQCFNNALAFGFLSSDQNTIQFFDQIIYSLYNIVSNDSLNGNQKKSAQIDSMILYVYEIIRRIPEYTIQYTNFQNQIFRTFLYRILVFYNIFCSPTKDSQLCQDCLTKEQSIDKQAQDIDIQDLTVQNINSFFSQIPDDLSFKDNSQFVSYFVYQSFFCIIQHFLNQQTYYNKCQKNAFLDSFCKTLEQLRPQLHPQFLPFYVNLLTESTFLTTCLTFCPEDLDIQSSSVNLLKHYSNYKQKSFAMYFIPFRHFITYFYDICNNKNNYMQQQARVFLRFIIIAQHEFPQFINCYRMKIADLLHPSALQLRSYLFADYSIFPITKRISGLLSIPETDYFDSFALNQLDKDVQVKIHSETKDTGEYIKVITTLFDSSLKFKYSEYAAFLHQILLINVKSEMQKKRLQETTGFQIICKLLQSNGVEVQKRILLTIMTFISNPCVETYLFANIIIELKKAGICTGEISDIMKKVCQSYGMKVLQFQLQSSK